MTTKPNASRREFLRTASILSMVGSAGAPFALNLATIGAAAAQTAPTDYKAIVCLFMAGGNDHGNTVMATDSTSWSEYIRLRTTTDAGSIALPAVGNTGGVLPITPLTVQSGRTFALHPSMQALKTVFDAGRVAVVANVGPLIMPTTLAQYKANSVKLPPKLFSHNDQQSLWQSSMPEGAKSGWGGRMGDLLVASNSTPIFTAISVSGNAVFLAGQTINQYQVSNSGAVPINSLSGSLYGSSAAANPLQAIVSADRGNLFEKEQAAVIRRSIAAQGTLATGMLAAGGSGIPNPAQYINPNTGNLATNSLAVQLQTVARIIGGRSALGAKRQIFFVNIGGFDTHDNQRTNQADLLARVAHGLAYFDSMMGSLQGTDFRNQVTLFTASDFGRTFTSNGDGTDHGWGSHHFVMGGAVKGQDMYGLFPVTGVKHDQDVGSGSLLPQFSVDQYGATLASWFGLSATQIADVFPSINNFTQKNIGFMM
ncbi:uncharacterized protein (DUF1501 family) [Actimicrobium sp. GrIS 1.19]|uniref:DUF1501 domain-containing protein n=1 Tax=Actimicrobium sp. GrIS 1.19 TaxID=3071708 RepID=UPI002E052813|nr:uncharacterized protein (DUF1501 family) [Actimicrobium sp. GrIS 1.19]